MPCVRQTLPLWTILLLACPCFCLSEVWNTPTSNMVTTDLSGSPVVFESDVLPENMQHMASVGNGQVATTVYTDTVYMNGLYSGQRGESHRARIPSRINIRVDADGRNDVTKPHYSLDVSKAIFTETFNVSDVVIQQTTYAHRVYTSLLVTQIQANFNTMESVTLNLTNNPGPDSSDITFEDVRGDGPDLWTAGQTKIIEDIKYQSFPSPVYVVWTDVPSTITLNVSNPVYTFVMATSETYAGATQDYSLAKSYVTSNRSDELLALHYEAWSKVWEGGNVHLEGENEDLVKTVYGSIYYLLTSLPSHADGQRKPFYGLSPGGLANGGLLQDYQGHSFWDTETWMFPPILMLWPDIAKDLLLYRMARMQPARDRAAAGGYAGARFPWESAYTGTECTPDCCPETRENQQHVTGDIAFAARLYWSATKDKGWLFGEKYNYPVDINGCDFIREMAEFWASRAEYNPDSGFYEINGVMPPDEDHLAVNNSVYTNTVAAYSIFFAKHAKCLCDTQMTGDIPDEWLDTARRLKFNYDPDNNYHPEFDGYVINEQIKQADVVLLGFPIMHVTDPVQRRNDLEIYEPVTRSDGPAMTWSMHAVGFLEINDTDKARDMFVKSYQPYKTEPFKVWTEAQGQQGAVNFITGMGGFLQAIIFGYGGIRLHVDQLSANPVLPPGISNFTIQGLDYQNCSLNMRITQANVSVLSAGNCEIELVTQTDNAVYPLTSGTRAEFKRQRFVIRPTEALTCPLPEDQLGVNGSLAPKLVLALLYSSMVTVMYFTR